MTPVSAPESPAPVIKRFRNLPGHDAVLSYNRKEPVMDVGANGAIPPYIALGQAREGMFVG